MYNNSKVSVFKYTRIEKMNFEYIASFPPNLGLRYISISCVILFCEALGIKTLRISAFPALRYCRQFLSYIHISGAFISLNVVLSMKQLEASPCLIESNFYPMYLIPRCAISLQKSASSL